ncbi:MAG: tyrosine recombinase XerD [Crocinitomicaceae bacterium]|nr:tyrosine recombinase XerD [Crocinitomicaceae bacterium]|tara:strand:+ start:2386 stop:3294 length:909 start_codon:yes stop_codon:yes gene_type:complete
MSWKTAISGYKNYLLLERSLSKNTVDGYIRDVKKFCDFFSNKIPQKMYNSIDSDDFQGFLSFLHDEKISARSQSRAISSIKSFYKYLLLEKLISSNPSELIETPKIGRKLPEFLTIEEIDELIAAIDRSKPDGERNVAIIEVLYGCGLRVSELINLSISEIYWDEGFVRIIGKGDKQRLVPLGSVATKHLKIYLETIRNKHKKIESGCEDIVFLNKLGNKISRVMIFKIIKNLTSKSGIKKTVSPHTLRHSFATHLVEGGADLRAVQEMLGHESITTTEVYTHLDRNYLRQTILDHHPLERK